MENDHINTIAKIIGKTFEYTLAERAAMELHKQGYTSEDIHEFMYKTATGQAISAPWTNETYNALRDIERE